MSTKRIIYDNHWGGGSTKRWIQDEKYLVTAVYATGSSICVEPLEFFHGVDGWFYMSETEDECVQRLISKIENHKHHASWFTGTPVWKDGERWYDSYGRVKYVDELTPELAREIENREDFRSWADVNQYDREWLTKGYENLR